MLNLGPFDLFVPIFMLFIALLYLPITAAILLVKADFARLANFQRLQQAWFQRFWSFFGWLSAPLFAPDVETILAEAQGVVLDVGSGAGDWLYCLSPRQNSKISEVLLLEPNTNFHARLRASAERNGLAGRYEILGCKAEELECEGVNRQSVDTIVTVHVLCSIPKPEDVAHQLYDYLKPGGRWLVYEHVLSTKAPVAALQGNSKTRAELKPKSANST